MDHYNKYVGLPDKSDILNKSPQFYVFCQKFSFFKLKVVLSYVFLSKRIFAKGLPKTNSTECRYNWSGCFLHSSGLILEIGISPHLLSWYL